MAVKQINKAVLFYPDDKRLSLAQKLIDTIIDLPEDAEDDFSKQLERIFGEEKLSEDLVNEFSTHLDIMPSFSEMIALFSNSKYAQEDEDISELMIPLILEHIDMHPDWPDLFNSLGSQFLFNEKLLEAESAFKKAVELNPDYVAARINLMKILKKMGKYQKAYDCGKLLLSKNLPYPDVYYSLAEILFSLNRFEEALSNANKVLQLRPEMKDAHLLIKQIYEKLEGKII